jgi:hypothetical protein
MEVDFRGHTLEKQSYHKPKQKELTLFGSIQIPMSVFHGRDGLRAVRLIISGP